MRRVASYFVLVVVVAAAAWTGLWFYGAGAMKAGADDWIATERAQGRVWTCPDRAVGGYPFALDLVCRDATFAGQAMGQAVTAKLARVSAAVNLARPRQLALALAAPFSFRTSDGQTSVDGTWQSLDVDVGSLPAVDAIALHAKGVTLAGVFAGTGPEKGAADALDLHAGYADASVLAFDVGLKSLAMPELDAFLGGAAPADVAMAGRIDHAGIGGARTPEQAMEFWRAAGGRIAIERSRASRAGASVEATGTLGLDEAHRLRGRLDAEFLGLEPILARYGIHGNLAVVGSLVSALFGGGGSRKAPAAPGAIDLPISFTNGRLGVGPITTPVRLNPLY